MEYRSFIDKLHTVLKDEEELKKSVSVRSLDEEEITKLKFSMGDKVIDTVTGEEVTIVAGRRAFTQIRGTGGEGD